MPLTVAQLLDSMNSTHAAMMEETRLFYETSLRGEVHKLDQLRSNIHDLLDAHLDAAMTTHHRIRNRQ